MFSQQGGTKIIAANTKFELRNPADHDSLLADILNNATQVEVLSETSLCAIVFKITFNNPLTTYQLRSQEIDTSGHPIDPTLIDDPSTGFLHSSVVLKMTIVREYNNPHPVKNFQPLINNAPKPVVRKSGVTALEAIAEYRGQEYIHAMLRSISGVSPCPDAIANVRITTQLNFASDIQDKILNPPTKPSAFFNHDRPRVEHALAYFYNHLNPKYSNTAIDILIMDTVNGGTSITAYNINDPIHLKCCALFATVVVKTGFSGADAHNGNWLVGPGSGPVREISMIDFGRGTYLLSINGIPSIIAGLERVLNPLQYDDNKRDPENVIRYLSTCLNIDHPTGITWKEWFTEIITFRNTPYGLKNTNIKIISRETINNVRKILEKFCNELLGDPRCPGFLLTQTHMDVVCANLHKLFVLTALCGGLFHAIGWHGALHIQFQTLHQLYASSYLQTFEDIITNMNVDLTIFLNSIKDPTERARIKNNLELAAILMQDFIKDNTFPSGIRTPTTTGLGEIGQVDARKAAALLAAAQAKELAAKKKAAYTAASNVQLASASNVHRASALRRDHLLNPFAAEARRPIVAAHRPPGALVLRRPPTGAIAAHRSPTGAKRGREDSPHKTPRKTKNGGRIKRRRNRTTHRRQYRHTRKLRN